MSSTTVFVVDPDESSRDSVCRIADNLGLRCEGYTSAEGFLEAYNGSQPGCLVAEFKLSGVGGIELQEILATHQALLSVVFVTHLANTQQTVRAMRNGAVTVLDHPISSQDLSTAIQKAVARSKEHHRVAKSHQKTRARCAKLSDDERAILPFVQARMSNKRIAKLLGVKKRNVRIARRRIFKKTKSASLAELSRTTREASVDFEFPTNPPTTLGPGGPAQVHNKADRQDREVFCDVFREMLSYAFQTSIPGLVGEVVHEISQPLSVIVNASTLIENAVRPEQSLNINEIRQWNGMISDAAIFAAEVVRRCQAFAKTQRIDQHDEQLEEIVQESIQMLRFTAQEHHVEIRLEMGEVIVLVDRRQIQQVTINLLKNAIESTSGNPLNDRIVNVKISADLDCANMIVSDNGSGVNEADARNIFQPFLSSKAHGLGLGLAITKGIVESHGGQIWYEPNHAKGASFHVRLPLSPRDPRHPTFDDSTNSVSRNDGPRQ